MEIRRSASATGKDLPPGICPSGAAEFCRPFGADAVWLRGPVADATG